MPQKPIELFGHNIDLPVPDDENWNALKNETTARPFKEMPCPFSGEYCNKIRKAAPNPLIGNCIVRVDSRGAVNDWIVCPQRMNQDDIIFKDCLNLLPGKKDKIFISREMKIGGYGNLDFALVSENAENEYDGFLGIEVQTMGTSSSGPIWTARNDYLTGQLGDDYKYGVNVKDASKKILIQMLHKGSQLARWRSSLVLVIQDCFLTHLRDVYNIDAHFHDAQEQDFIHIHAYKVVPGVGVGENKIELKERISTDILGLSMALISNPANKYADFSTIEKALDTRLKAFGKGEAKTIRPL